MNGLKRLVAIALFTAVFFPCAVLRASAATGSLVGFSGNREIVRIHLTQDSGSSSDFAAKLPKRLYVNEETMEFPVEEWEIYERSPYGEIPMYFQSDYPDALYGEGTVADCGSSITALAMVATYLTGYDYSPQELARHFAGKADENVGRLNIASKSLGLPVAVSENWSDVPQALTSGKTVILQLDRLSAFTDSEETHAQHFVILTGKTKDGKFLVQDPQGAHYVNEKLQEGFLNGFEETDVSAGFRYAWIYDKSQIPKNLARYADTEEPATKNRYSKIKLTPAEKQLLARVVAVNGYGECVEGQQAMLEVLLNRMLSSEFPDSLKELLFGEEPMCDTALLNDAQLTAVEYRIVERALNGPYVLSGTKITDFSFQCHK